MKIEIYIVKAIDFLVQSYKERLEENDNLLAKEFLKNVKLPKDKRSISVLVNQAVDALVIEAEEAYLDEIANDMPAGSQIYNEMKDAIQDAKEHA